MDTSRTIRGLESSPKAHRPSLTPDPFPLVCWKSKGPRFLAVYLPSRERLYLGCQTALQGAFLGGIFKVLLEIWEFNCFFFSPRGSLERRRSRTPWGAVVAGAPWLSSVACSW